MKEEFIQEMAERCRTIAGNADIYTKRRLLDLAAKYDALVGKPSPASRKIERPILLRFPAGQSPAAPRLLSMQEPDEARSG
jgi:hypothetical protein